MTPKECGCKKMIGLRDILSILGLLRSFAVLLLILGFIFSSFGIYYSCVDGGHSDRNYFTAAGSMFTAAAFFYTAYRYLSDSIRKKSEFYLKQIKGYFKDAIRLISDPKNNNNVDWHLAVRFLKTATDLFLRLSERAHKEIYFTDYMDTAFRIFNVINKIDSYKFFYGVKSYLGKDDMDLYRESNPQGSLGYISCLRVSPESLHFLGGFIDKANRIAHDNEVNKTAWIDCVEKGYFKIPITADYQISSFANIPKIIEYVTSYSKCESAKKISKVTV